MTNKKSKTLSTLFASGLFLMIVAAGIIVLNNSVGKNSVKHAKAEATTWNSTWNVAKWRNVNFGSAGTVSIGPSQWSVTGSVGGQNYTENWQAGGWKEGRLFCDQIPNSADGVCSSSFLNGTFSDGDYTAISKGMGNATLTFTSGLYTALAGTRDNTTDYHRIIRASFVSIPSTWTVSGQMN